MGPKLRRQGSAAVRSRLSLAPSNVDGEKPADTYSHYCRMDLKKRQQLFENLTKPMRMSCGGFLANLEKNRDPIPINDKTRVINERKEKDTMEAGKDGEYVPASYAKLDRDDYIIWQAPTKDNLLAFWRNMWQDQVKLVLSLSEKTSDSEPDKCYPYWPTKEDCPVNLQSGRYVIKLLKKTDHKGWITYELEVTSTDESEMVDRQKKGDKSTEEEEEKETTPSRQMTVMHFDSWPEGAWPNVDTFAACIQALAKKEMQIIRKSVDQFTPPVVLQGHGGVGRTAVAWVAAILMKDVEKKDCFDIPYLIKNLIRLRPGALHQKIYYCAAFAVGFRCAGLTAWMSEEEARKSIKEIEAAYKESK